jgi:hypothetical protein
VDGYLAQARYDNNEQRWNIREMLARLNGMGIKVVFDWNGSYVESAPYDLQQCLDETWELRWREADLNALMKGTPLPRYTPRPANVDRVIPLGWKQCGSGGPCPSGNPYCPSRSYAN